MQALALRGSQSIKTSGFDVARYHGMVALPKKRSIHSEPHVRSSKMWIQDLREICEKSFDNRETGQLEVESLRVEWQKAFSEERGG